MAKRNDLKAAMKTRSPAAMRQAITPVNIFADVQATETERKEQAEKAHEKTARQERSIKSNANTERNKRTMKANVNSVRINRTLLEPDKRETSRESFEVYLDQLATIDQLRKIYKRRTGKPLPKSRIVREALDMFLPLALNIYQDDKE